VQGAVPVEAAWEVARQKEEWEIARYKAMIVAHPLYLQLLELHASCLRMGTPVDQLRNIDMQMERYMDVTNKYAVLQLDLGPEEQAELNEFMVKNLLLHADHM
jgi:homeobox protein Meis1